MPIYEEIIAGKRPPPRPSCIQCLWRSVALTLEDDLARQFGSDAAVLAYLLVTAPDAAAILVEGDVCAGAYGHSRLLILDAVCSLHANATSAVNDQCIKPKVPHSETASSSATG